MAHGRDETMNIAFSSTNYGPLWSPVVSSWLRCVGYTSRYYATTCIGKLGAAGITDRMYTMSAENRIVREFLAAEPAMTHLFMTEADMVLPHDCIVKLAELDKDIASGVYFLRSDVAEGRGQPCLYKKAAMIPARVDKVNTQATSPYAHTPITLFPQNEPFRVDCSGLGCVLIKRQVFEKLPEPWFNMNEGTNGKIGFGSDIYFYKHAKDHGIELWVDPSVQPGQIDYYVTDIEDYKWQLDNNPGFGAKGFIVGLGGDGIKAFEKAVSP